MFKGEEGGGEVDLLYEEVRLSKIRNSFESLHLKKHLEEGEGGGKLFIYSPCSAEQF